MDAAGIGVPFNGANNLIHWLVHALCHRFDDAPVRLVRDQPVNLVGRHTVCGEGRRSHRPAGDRVTEDFLTLHGLCRPFAWMTVRHPIKHVTGRAVGVQMR